MALHRISEFSAAHHLHQPVMVYLNECSEETACKVSLTETMVVAKYNIIIEPWILAAETVVRDLFS